MGSTERGVNHGLPDIVTLDKVMGFTPVFLIFTLIVLSSTGQVEISLAVKLTGARVVAVAVLDEDDSLPVLSYAVT